MEQIAREGAERRTAIEVAAIAADIHAGQNDLADALIHHGLRLSEDRRGRHAAVVAAAERNDAEGAAVIAALLDLQEAAGMARERSDRLCPRGSGGHDVADGDALSSRGIAL